MPTGPAQTSKSLGVDIRALRRARGMTLADMGLALARSVGWVSQVERDLSHPSIDDLRAIAAIFDVPVSMFFGQTGASETEQGYVVRKEARRKIGSGEGGLIEELLSPDLTDEFEVVHSVFQPGASLPKPNKRPTQEVGYVIKGRLDMMIGTQGFSLESGDSFRIRGEEYRWSNPHAEPAEVIWVIAPPVY